MRAVIQRVHEARCEVADEVTGAIGRGVVVFLGITDDDGDDDLAWICRKIPQLRIFEDEEGRMNQALTDVGGGVLLISQFTLYGNLKKGSRPSFNRAAGPDHAVPLYEAAIAQLSASLGQPVATGRFGAMMKITAVNDGPVTLILDSRQKDF